jgi:hypothetical protein
MSSPNTPTNLQESTAWERIILKQIGRFRTFGTEGPIYEIIGNSSHVSNGDRFVIIRVVESGEELEYPYSQLVLDPEVA